MLPVLQPSHQLVIIPMGMRRPQWRGHGLGRRPRTQRSTTDPDCRDQAELARRAISSAVEHLPYKEIVTGSIPVSPISHSKAFQPFSAHQSVGLMWILLRLRALKPPCGAEGCAGRSEAYLAGWFCAITWFRTFSLMRARSRST